MKIIIVGGGDFDSEVFLRTYDKLNMLNDEPFVIGVDKGLVNLYECDVKPDYIIGDFDSAPELKAKYESDENVTLLPIEKDLTDTESAGLKAIELGASEVYLFGMTGGRLDHFLANIGGLKRFVEAGVKAYIIDTKNRISLINGSTNFRKCDQYGRFIAFWPYAMKVDGISLKGFKYNGENLTFEQGFSLSISNEIEDEIATIEYKKGLLFVIESRD